MRASRRRQSDSKQGSNRWPAQAAKARFSELLGRARTEGPQIVTVHGKDVVRVSAIAPEEDDKRTGQAIIDAMQASPAKDFELVPPKFYGRFRTIKL